MTPPTFQELLTSQEARDRAVWFFPCTKGGPNWMNRYGSIFNFKNGDITQEAIWQGYIQEAAPPPEPRVFKRVMYFNVYDSGIAGMPRETRQIADGATSFDRIACVRVEITATEGVFDD